MLSICRLRLEVHSAGSKVADAMIEAQNRMVKRRQCMHIDVVGFLAPTERGLRPQLLLKVVPAQITLDNRRAIFDRRADKSVLVYLRDN